MLPSLGRWKQKVPPKRRYPTTTLYSATTQQAATWIVETVKATVEQVSVGWIRQSRGDNSACAVLDDVTQ
jgi:hypothetical protein